MRFLSSNTQDFIEVGSPARKAPAVAPFLSSNTQDFIEVAIHIQQAARSGVIFLSSNTQDFIEVGCDTAIMSNGS